MIYLVCLWRRRLLLPPLVACPSVEGSHQLSLVLARPRKVDRTRHPYLLSVRSTMTYSARLPLHRACLQPHPPPHLPTQTQPTLRLLLVRLLPLRRLFLPLPMPSARWTTISSAHRLAPLRRRRLKLVRLLARRSSRLWRLWRLCPLPSLPSLLMRSVGWTMTSLVRPLRPAAAAANHPAPTTLHSHSQPNSSSNSNSNSSSRSSCHLSHSSSSSRVDWMHSSPCNPHRPAEAAPMHNSSRCEVAWG